MMLMPPRFTRTDTLSPYTTPVRSSVGGVEQLGKRTLALAAPAAAPQHDQDEGRDDGDPQHEDLGQEGGNPAGEAAVCPEAVVAGKFPAGAGTWGRRNRLTPGVAVLNIPRLMSTDVPEILEDRKSTRLNSSH